MVARIHHDTRDTYHDTIHESRFAYHNNSTIHETRNAQFEHDSRIMNHEVLYYDLVDRVTCIVSRERS